MKNNEQNKTFGPNIINGKTVVGALDNPLAGGYSSDIMFLLTGKYSETFYNSNNENAKDIKNCLEKIKKSPDKFAATCNFRKAKHGIYINHAYSIKNVDNDFVILVNPHNSAETEKIPINDFLNSVRTVTILGL